MMFTLIFKFVVVIYSAFMFVKKKKRMRYLFYNLTGFQTIREPHFYFAHGHLRFAFDE